MPQDPLKDKVDRLMAAGASDDDIVFFMQQEAKARADAPGVPERSLGGFVENVGKSGARFLSDTAKGLWSIPAGIVKMATTDPVKGGQAIIDTLKAAPAAIQQAVMNRYGSWENIKTTLYDDPVGVLADISTLTGAGAATKIPKIAGTLGKVSTATNPLRMMAKPLATATEFGTAAAIRPMLGPPKALIRQTRAPLEIERTALKTGAFTQGRATDKMREAAATSTQLAKEATDAGVTVPRGDVAQFPKTLQKVENLTPNIKPLDDLAALEADTVASLPANLTPSELLTRRRGLDEAVDSAFRAEDRGGYIRSTADKGQKELAGNFRGTLRKVVPEIAKSDTEARQLMLVGKALEDASTRPKTIPMSAALAGGGAAMFGIPAAGPAAAMAIGRTWPQIPLALGSVPVRGTQALADLDPNLLMAALVARLTGQTGPDEE
jgi:hypothetical protein